MHIRQLLVASVILFGTAQMEAGKNRVKKTWTSYRKIKNAKKKRDLNDNEKIKFNSFDTDNTKKSTLRPNPNYDMPPEEPPTK